MTTLASDHPLAAGLTASSPLVRAYQGERQEVTPVWFMRQAGRSLPEYRELRVGTRMLDACLDPAMASEITLQPVRRHGVDAGIFFSDIVVPLKLAGVDVEIVPGKGPVFAQAVRTAADVERLTAIDPASLDESVFAPIQEAVRITVAELGSTPLIGFAGAPFTLAAYLVEGGPSKDHIRARTLMHADPEAWARLMEWTADVSGAFLRAQVLAGASAAQLFDSWAGSLSLHDYVTHVAPASARALSHVRDLAYELPRTAAAGDAEPALDDVVRNVPLVHFGVGTGELLKAMHEVGADAVGVDYRIPLDEASRRLGHVVPVQGNVDPAMLDAPWPVLEAHVRDVLDRGREAPAHILNLGHGVPPETDPTVLTRVVELVHGWRPE
ncbi:MULTISPECIES: uroporphyrinogen decarboxylase [unclassified Leifsonia]|uniref:uroporphyrinogen decarboxylase n=1 Tax=unclassified Leifsonia TaxID=2663824 RepID=UPI000371BC6F|nr:MULTISPECIES: uroporphyrinogen decarboxylase [unclassified Leifsonia]TDQ01981.1 uroporphyrinogen decarboxylase [Leifsonia sp. 115AMFTsu3.1]